MIIIEFAFIISVGVLIGIGIFNSVKISQQQQRLENAFYHLLEAQNGEVSLIQLAAGARVEAELSRQYLERQAKVFSASLEVDDDGNTYYRFPKLRLPGNN
ncbi:hypothetical protein [Microcoleus sp. FACHB-68]|uniref:hypothetical protein n=1 Tax=Microcoleus sp. FACHB-68 TaxID=2692826 RepID=UPI001684A921|nr:hypothetical protein [Microcoleus sp. FACHB-68]MBD1938018.1 hypothetical protein [Microcoleus sp. FACHB-68]